MLHRLTPDGGRIDDHALDRWRALAPRSADGASLLLVALVLFAFLRVCGCTIG
ncbi:MAG: hypothetical protein RMA76_10115 [Deltaproteobacteria bacterium]